MIMIMVIISAMVMILAMLMHDDDGEIDGYEQIKSTT